MSNALETCRRPSSFVTPGKLQSNDHLRFSIVHQVPACMAARANRQLKAANSFPSIWRRKAEGSNSSWSIAN
jgi:hypothetical protein